jgi:hypothetical protein
MPIQPKQSNDFFDIAGQFLEGNSFASPAVPSSSGLGTRQGRIRNNRPAYSVRNMVRWLIPDGPIVEMYINPQSIRYNYRKDIPGATKTKGGYILQYWGEQLTTLAIEGTTGSSGIEGINVLYDVYRNEQAAFDPYALYLAAENERNQFSNGVFGIGDALEESQPFLATLLGAETPGPHRASQAPSLAALAFTVEMYWSGEVYRGYFNDFTVTESADKIGLFYYSINFTVTQKRGFRQNFFPWHRSAVSGPSNSDPELGTPYSFGGLVIGEQATAAGQRQSSGSNLVETLQNPDQLFSTPFDF